MKKLLLVLSLVLAVVGCGDTGIHGTFVPEPPALTGAVVFEGKTAYINILFGQSAFDCEITDLKDTNTGRVYKGIKFEDKARQFRFFAEILEVDSSGKIQVIDIHLPFYGKYRRRQES